MGFITTKLALGLVIFVGISLIEGRTLMSSKNIPLLGHEGPLSTSDERSQELLKKGSTVNSGGDSRIAGGQAIAVMREPSFTQLSQGLLGDDHYLDIRLEGIDWSALFIEVLQCPSYDVSHDPRRDVEELREEYRSMFQRAIPNNPMLSRVWDTLIFVSFEPHEISQLRNECLRIQSTTSNRRAQEALGKLVYACDKANQVGSGLLFVPD